MIHFFEWKSTLNAINIDFWEKKQIPDQSYDSFESEFR